MRSCRWRYGKCIRDSTVVCREMCKIARVPGYHLLSGSNSRVQGLGGTPEFTVRVNVVALTRRAAVILLYIYIYIVDRMSKPAHIPFFSYTTQSAPNAIPGAPGAPKTAVVILLKLDNATLGEDFGYLWYPIRTCKRKRKGLLESFCSFLQRPGLTSYLVMTIVPLK